MKKDAHKAGIMRRNNSEENKNRYKNNRNKANNEVSKTMRES